MVDLGPLGEDDHPAPAHDPHRCGVCTEARRRARLHSPGTRRDLGHPRVPAVVRRAWEAGREVGELPFPTLVAVVAAATAGVALLVATGSILRLLVLWAIGAAILAGGWQADRKSRPANAPSAEQPVPAPEEYGAEWYAANGMPQSAVVAAQITALREAEAPAAPEEVRTRTWTVPCVSPRCDAAHTVVRRGREVVVLPAHPMLRVMDGWTVRCPRGGSYTWRPAEGFEYRIAEPGDVLELFSPEEA